VLEQYPKKVKYAFKHFPLRNHRFAMPAALASMAAHRQGNFWPFQDKLFESYNKLNEQKISEIAVGLGLNMVQFDKDRKDPALKNIVDQDVRDGRNAGVRGTPSIFINGRRLKNRSLQGFRQMIDKQLQRSP
jgi:protein-disulfide isomerase